MERVKSFFEKYFLDIKISRDVILIWTSLILLYLIALIIRLYPLLVNEAYIRAYDPFIQYYAAIQIEKHGLLNFITGYYNEFWYPWGVYLGQTLYLVIPVAGVLLHKFFLLIGVKIDLLTAVALVPAIFGSFTIFPIYGIAKEVKSERAGLFAAFFAAMSPGLLQRTVIGFYDNESIGILLTLLVLYMFIKSIKSDKHVHYSVLAGFALGLLTLNWGAYRYVYDLLALYIVIVVIIGKADSETISSYIITIALALAIGSIAPRNFGLITSTDMFIAVVVSVFAIVFQIIYSVTESMGQASKEFLMKVGIVSAIFFGFVAAIFISFQSVSPMAAKFVRVINPLLREVSPAFSSVSENQPASWGTMFLGIYLPIMFIPIGIYYFIEDRKKESIFTLLLVLTAIYFSASISRFIVVGAPVAAAVAAIGVDYLLDPFARILRGEWFVHHIKPIRKTLGEQRLPKGEAVVVYALILLLALATVNHAIWAAKGLTSYDTASYEKEAFNYLEAYASTNDVVLSWWDYGYRLSVLAHVRTLADNATSNSTQMGVVGAMLMLPPKQAIRLMKRYNVKYVVVYSVDILKAIWMIRISEKYAPELGVKESDYYSAKDGGYKQKFFQSVLWTLLAYQDNRVEFWVRNFAVKDLRDKADQLKVSDLHYFKLVLNTQRDSHQQNLKIYQVIYREPGLFYPNDSSINKNPVNNVEQQGAQFMVNNKIRKFFNPLTETSPLIFHQISPKFPRGFVQ
ncbi:MAG: STT3 domain-containing protein [Candidatus Njordarchaeia archaeon]